MMMRRFFIFCFGLIVISPVFAQIGSDQISADGHWLEFRGKKVLLVGDSVTQGWMELGTNFDQNAYIDALATRGINVLKLWSYMGIVDQKSDPRLGYAAPAIRPWVKTGDRFELTQLNDIYFDRLRGSAFRVTLLIGSTVGRWPTTQNTSNLPIITTRCPPPLIRNGIGGRNTNASSSAFATA